jgi:cytochrome c553
MRFITKTSVVVAALFVASAAFAEGSPEMGNLANGKKIFENGKGDVPACNSCHGKDGMGDDTMGTPRLAGQGYMYIVKELTDFATDKRKDLTMFIMNTNAKGLTPQDRKDVATYVNSLTRDSVNTDLSKLKDLGQTVGVRYLGKSIVKYGAADRGIPACYSCHGYNGRGAAPQFPTIGSQRFVYLMNQLTRWKDGTLEKGRRNDPMGMMRAVAKNLTEEDMRNVATFLTTAPRTTLGNHRTPREYAH